MYFILGVKKMRLTENKNIPFKLLNILWIIAVALAVSSCNKTENLDTEAATQNENTDAKSNLPSTSIDKEKIADDQKERSDTCSFFTNEELQKLTNKPEIKFVKAFEGAGSPDKICAATTYYGYNADGDAKGPHFMYTISKPGVVQDKLKAECRGFADVNVGDGISCIKNNGVNYGISEYYIAFSCMGCETDMTVQIAAYLGEKLRNFEK
jgi:hypothetical protein